MGDDSIEGVFLGLEGFWCKQNPMGDCSYVKVDTENSVHWKFCSGSE